MSYVFEFFYKKNIVSNTNVFDPPMSGAYTARHCLTNGAERSRTFAWHTGSPGLIPRLDRHCIFGVKTWLSTLGTV